MESLADTAGAETVARLTQSRNAPDPAYFIGKGKLEELKEKCEELDADLIIVDSELSPVQQRNIEETTNVRVIDRSELILDIFATRARTNHAKLQVELAQLEYLRPRLVRMWSHLSRQRGGVGAKAPIGVRGAGEKQLELDRRQIADRISALKKNLNDFERQHEIQTQGREDYIQAALVGYTNAGKSTLMHRLSSANVFVEDKLFATLDATTREVTLDAHSILLTDTIGFIRKLPHHLIVSFHATLEEVIDADFLIHVVDITHPQAKEQIQTVNTVLEELNSLNKPIIMVFNKIDKIPDVTNFKRLYEGYDYSVQISAKENMGIDELKETMHQLLNDLFYQEVRMEIPSQNTKLVSDIYEIGEVISKEYKREQIILIAKLQMKDIGRYRKYIAK